MGGYDGWLESPAHPSMEYCIDCRTRTDNGDDTGDGFVCADCVDDRKDKEDK